MGKRTKGVASPESPLASRASRSTEKASEMGMHLWINEEKNQGFFCLCQRTQDHVEAPVFR